MNYKIFTDQSFDQWPSARKQQMTNRHSDVASTHQYLAQNFRPAPHCWDSVIYVLKFGIWSHSLGAMSDVSQQSCITMAVFSALTLLVGSFDP